MDLRGKSIFVVDCPGLVVPTEEIDVRWELHFVAKEQTDQIDGVISAIDIVAQKEIATGGAITTEFKKLDDVDKLAVRVAANHEGDRA
jgi:hypothetical protein